MQGDNSLQVSTLHHWDRLVKNNINTDSYLSNVNDNSALILNLVLLSKITGMTVVPAG